MEQKLLNLLHSKTDEMKNIENIWSRGVEDSYE